MQAYLIKNIGGQPKAAIFSEQSRDSEKLSPSIQSDQLVEILQDVDETVEWVRARHSPLGVVGTEGWLETRYLGEPQNMPHPACSANSFVYACARSEFSSEAGGEDQYPAIMADFLMALADMEHGGALFADPADTTADLVFERTLDDGGAIGPFLLTAGEWESYTSAISSTTIKPVHRRLPFRQVAAADFILRGLLTAFAAFAKEKESLSDAQDYVPSFLDLYTARLIGAKAAYLAHGLERDEADKPLADIIVEAGKTADEAAAMIDRRAAELKKADGAAHTARSLRDACRERLKTALAAAHAALNAHYPAFAQPPAPGAAPWFDKATGEEPFWADKDETSPAGLARIGEYFDTIGYTGAKTDPWCGGFAGFCVKEAGGQPVKGPARAVHWAGFGDYALRVTDQVPPGAVIVTKPAPGTNGSGHVTFCAEYPAGDTFIGLGGNQGNKVKRSTYRKENIRAIRMVGAPTSGGGGGGGGGGSADDALTLARTLYGEARGEGVDGMAAVANVIMNRTQSSRYPDVVAEVCLQAWQFSCWNLKDPNRSVIAALEEGANQMFDKALGVAKKAVQGVLSDVTGNALHYHATSIRPPSWAKTGQVSATIGNHIFYRDVD